MVSEIVPNLPFVGLMPLWTTYVGGANASDGNSGGASSPFATIQKAVDLAVGGTRILVRPGTYGSFEFRDTFSRTSSAAPIWLISEIQDQAVIAHNGPVSGRPINGNSEGNLVISGFVIRGGADCIHFGFANGIYSANIVVQYCTLIGDGVSTKDGVKIDHTVNAHVINCNISRTKEQGVDFLAVIGGSIQRNTMSDQIVGTSEPQCFVKGGSRDIAILYNTLTGAAVDGLGIGGRTDPSLMHVGATCEALNVTVKGNKVSAGTKRGLLLLGAQEILLLENDIKENSAYWYAAAVGTGSKGLTNQSFSREIYEIRDRYSGAGRVQVEVGNEAIHRDSVQFKVSL